MKDYKTIRVHDITDPSQIYQVYNNTGCRETTYLLGYVIIKNGKGILKTDKPRELSGEQLREISEFIIEHEY